MGLLTRLGAIALLIDISVAIATTNVPILLTSGFFAMEDPARTDYSMFMSLLFLLIVGGGRWSLDTCCCRGGLYAVPKGGTSDDAAGGRASAASAWG
jgi:hypothetical protein